MRHNTSNRRSRGRNNNRGKGGNNRSQVFDSNGPEVRIRGTAHQILEKYEALAKDARSSGDKVLAESYLQHAEHYQRIISTWDEQAAQQNQQRDDQRQQKQKSENSNDDLSLPTSILGDEVKAASQNSGQAVRQLEDA